MPINIRQTNSCSAGYSFYTCGTNGFRGCCSQDACTDPDGCPDNKRDPNNVASSSQADASRTISRDNAGNKMSTNSPSAKAPVITFASTSTNSLQTLSPTHRYHSSSNIPTGSRPSATAAAPTAATKGETSSSNSTIDTSIIIGVVVGVVVAAIAIWLLWFGVRRRRKRMRDEATKPEQEQWLPGQGSPQSNQGLGIYSDRYYSAALGAPDTLDNSQAPSNTGLESTGQSGQKRAPYSPWSFMFPSKHDGSVPPPESSPNSGSLFPSPTAPTELSAEPSPKAELSPNPEALEINRSRLSSKGMPTIDGHTSTQHPPEATEMRCNLDVSDDDDRRRGSHVMSWMSYGDGAAGPASGAA